MLWLKRGDLQSLAFVEPHGMVIWDQTKVDLLQDIRGLGLSVPTVAYIVTPTSQKAIGAVGGQAVTETWLRDRHILLQKSSDYISVILDDLRRALLSVEEDQYKEGRTVGRFRVIDGRLVDSENVPDVDRYSTYAPVYSIRAAAGAFGAEEPVELDGWLAVDGPLTDDHFVVTAAGRSMEPRIRDGDLLLFQRYHGGTRQGKVVLAQWMGAADPETGGSFAVKRYHRVGNRGEEGMTIELQSENPEFDSIVLNPRYDDEVAVLAEFIEVLVPPR
jgi:phage repressor protein C with HTH and peptisase S24 domain